MDKGVARLGIKSRFNFGARVANNEVQNLALGEVRLR